MAAAAKRRKPSRPESRYCACPVCGKSVPIFLVSVHMDSVECATPAVANLGSSQQILAENEADQQQPTQKRGGERETGNEAGSQGHQVCGAVSSSSLIPSNPSRNVACDRPSQQSTPIKRPESGSTSPSCTHETHNRVEAQLHPCPGENITTANGGASRHGSAHKALPVKDETNAAASSHASRNFSTGTGSTTHDAFATEDSTQKASSSVSKETPQAMPWPIRDTSKKKVKIDNSVPCFDIPLYTTISDGPPGQIVLLDFISEFEEAEILRELLAQAPKAAPSWGPEGWKESQFNGLHVNQAWGVACDLKRRTVTPGVRAMPAWTAWVVKRWQETVSFLRRFEPNECNAIDYRRSAGHWLKAHCDDRRLSSDILVNLSLCGDAVMTYTRDPSLSAGKKTARNSGPEEYNVRLHRRSLQIQTGSCRYDFMHGIPKENLLDERRVSVTFRFSALTQAPSS